jgi:hypothetical protein
VLRLDRSCSTTARVDPTASSISPFHGSPSSNWASDRRRYNECSRCAPNALEERPVDWGIDRRAWTGGLGIWSVRRLEGDPRELPRAWSRRSGSGRGDRGYHWCTDRRGVPEGHRDRPRVRLYNRLQLAPSHNFPTAPQVPDPAPVASSSAPAPSAVLLPNSGIQRGPPRARRYPRRSPRCRW